MLPPSLVPPPFDPGSVWLVGAGPGDPGLLTLHALHALEQADIILHDALVSEEILSLAPRARKEPAGKRAGGHRTPQLRINQRLIALAAQGRRVVRLKGGDPLIFGRGGEEALALAAAGIPLTHRGIARTVTFATGHDLAGDMPDLDKAAASDVLVLYMAGRQLGAIAARLLAAGRDQYDAVALIRDATRPEQTVAVTTLNRVADQPAGAAPLLVVIGPSVALRDQLAAWQQTAPMTLPAHHARLAS